MSARRAPSSSPLLSASPLWTRAPLRDENGKSYFDFMMLIPGLKELDDAGIEATIVKIRKSLQVFENVVVYIDLNTRLNLLWISYKPVPDVMQRMVHAIQHEIPNAKVVAGDFNHESSRKKPSIPLLGRIRKRMKIAFSLGKS
jgi:hypothetical protein